MKLILLVGSKRFKKNQGSCIINGGKTAKYFKLDRGASQGDLIPVHLFILVLEIFFIFVKNNPRSKAEISLNMNFYALYMQTTLLSFSKIKIL